MMSYPTIRVEGTPSGQGSMRAFVVKGRAVLTSTNKKLKPWRKAIADKATLDGWKPGSGAPLEGRVKLSLAFYFPRPKSHYRKNSQIKDEFLNAFPRADLDKLVRAVGDALTGVCWVDDSQIAMISAFKVYITAPSTDGYLLIDITDLEDE